VAIDRCFGKQSKSCGSDYSITFVTTIAEGINILENFHSTVTTVVAANTIVTAG